MGIISEADAALDRVIAVWLNQPLYAAMYVDFIRFADFLGHPYVSGQRWVVNIEDPKIQEILQALDGPHCATMLKVFAVRREKSDADI